ncbi:MAG: hypothetical protein ACFE8N_13695 [Promethearchaeota archaeon]
MYCPKCERNVATKEQELNIPLAILLAIFTGGLGLLIYLAIYFDKRHRCVHCNNVCKTQVINDYPISSYQVVSSSGQVQKQQTVLELQPITGRAKFCYNCGVELSQNEEAKFCPLCGSNIE